MKKRKLFFIILSILGTLLIISSIIYSFVLSSNKNDSKQKSKSSSKILNLLKNDYMISNLIYGNPEVQDVPSVSIENVKYKFLVSDDVVSVETLQTLINNTYTGDLFSDTMVNLNSYNKYVEIENKLYVNVNSKCDIKKFTDKYSIVSETEDRIIIDTNNKAITIDKIDGNYKLKESAYLCDNE